MCTYIFIYFFKNLSIHSVCIAYNMVEYNAKDIRSKLFCTYSRENFKTCNISNTCYYITMYLLDTHTCHTYAETTHSSRLTAVTTLNGPLASDTYLDRLSATPSLCCVVALSGGYKVRLIEPCSFKRSILPVCVWWG